jgi:ubiquitin-conjugating enzyme E2 variant
MGTRQSRAARAPHDTLVSVAADAPRPRAVVAIEAAACAAFLALLAPLAARVWDAAPGGAARVLLIPAALLGYLAADLASGVVHWFCDRFLEEDTPVVGRLLIFPFRDHHRDPRAMTRHGLLELCGNSCLAVSPVLAGALAATPGPFLDGALLAFALAVVATNLLHGWAHAERPPGPVAWLQARRLVLAPAAHAAHHARGGRGAYCVTSGWANRWLDRLRVFERLEAGLVALGVPPTRAA